MALSEAIDFRFETNFILPSGSSVEEDGAIFSGTASLTPAMLLASGTFLPASERAPNFLSRPFPRALSDPSTRRQSRALATREGVKRETYIHVRVGRDGAAKSRDVRATGWNFYPPFSFNQNSRRRASRIAGGALQRPFFISRRVRGEERERTLGEMRTGKRGTRGPASLSVVIGKVPGENKKFSIPRVKADSTSRPEDGQL